MTVRRRVLVGGGARSGKSAFALRRAEALGRDRAFIATARRYDADLEDRIARHVTERAGRFDTIEEPVAVPERLAALQGYDVAVVDCLTLWLANLLVDGMAALAVERRIGDLAAALRNPSCHVVVVTNEVGMGVHPETALGRAFCDLAGRAHQRLARVVDEIHFAVLGTLLRLKPGPVEVDPCARSGG